MLPGRPPTPLLPALAPGTHARGLARIPAWGRRGKEPVPPSPRSSRRRGLSAEDKSGRSLCQRGHLQPREPVILVSEQLLRETASALQPDTLRCRYKNEVEATAWGSKPPAPGCRPRPRQSLTTAEVRRPVPRGVRARAKGKRGGPGPDGRGHSGPRGTEAVGQLPLHTGPALHGSSCHTLRPGASEVPARS